MELDRVRLGANPAVRRCLRADPARAELRRDDRLPLLRARHLAPVGTGLVAHRFAVRKRPYSSCRTRGRGKPSSCASRRVTVSESITSWAVAFVSGTFGCGSDGLPWTVR